jgi:hypothetical protein
VSDVFRRQQELLTEYKQKNREMKTRVADLDDKETRLNIIKTYVQDKHGALDMLEHISELPFIPERVTLTSFEYQKEETVKIAGHAKTLPDINTMEKAVSDTRFFDKVVQDSGTGKPTRIGNRPDQVLIYSITATLPKREVKRRGSDSSSGGSS